MKGNIRHTATLSALLLVATTTAAYAQTTADSRYASHSVLASGKWVKLRVGEAGIYQLTSSNLRSMGFQHPDRVRLYGLNLEVLPETNIENIADDLQEIPLYRTDGKMLFYGCGKTTWTLRSVTATTATFNHSNNPYSSYTCYFLTENDSAAMEFPKYQHKPAAGSPQYTTFPDHALIENDGFSYMNSGRMFFDPYDYANGSTRSYTLPVTDIAANSSLLLNLQFAANGTSSSTLEVNYNDATLGRISIAATRADNYEAAKLGSQTYTVTSPEASRHVVKLTHNRSSNVSGHLDYIRASYLHTLKMNGTSPLFFRPSASGDATFAISGATAQTTVWRIGTPDATEELDASYDASTQTLTVPYSDETESTLGWRNVQFVALNPANTYPTPTVVGRVENQDLHALQDIDLVIVVPSSGILTEQARRLARLHETADSMTCLVVSADKIYNEFSSGSPDATAIRRFMKMLYDRGQQGGRTPRNLLLFGTGAWDNRMVTSNMRQNSPDDYLLCYESDNSISHTQSYVLEDYYALVDDKAATSLINQAPRFGVGRLPVKTESEARTVVDKLESYILNEETGNWKNTICFLADDGNNNGHMHDADTVLYDVSKAYPEYRIKRIYWDTYTREMTSTGESYPAVTTDIYKQMQDGALIMNYTGHGAAYMLSHEKVLTTQDFENWSSPRLPLWITAACDVTPFDMNTENIGTEALLNPEGAAMGFVGTTRTVYSLPNRQLNRKLMTNLLGKKADGERYTLGEALAQAKSDLLRENIQQVNKAHFVLLGDPAVTLRTPSYKIAIDQINGTETGDGFTAPTVSAGSLVRLHGHVCDENGNTATDYQGVVAPVVLDNLETIVCKNNPKGDSSNGNSSTTPAFTFQDRPRMLYTLQDSIRNGEFTLTFPIPLDNNYSGASGQVSLYACNDSKDIEANGKFDDLVISGTAADLPADTLGPDIRFYLNSTSYRDGCTLNSTPMLFATLTDSDGINMTDNGVGHGISLAIDNKEATTYSLNNYFTPAMSDYQSGTLSYSIPTLDDGLHTVQLRAYDIFNNASTVNGYFYVNSGARPVIEHIRVNAPVTDQAVFTIVNDRPGTALDVRLKVYDLTGRLLWSTASENKDASGVYTYTWNLAETDSHVPSGIYIVKASLSSNGSGQTSESAKFIVTRPQ